MRALVANMPWSLWWFVLTAAVYLLQLFPITGVFLMLVAAPLWSIATVNLGFICIVAEVLSRRVAIFWLVLPVAWFGGYAGAALLSHHNAVVLDGDVRAINARSPVPFDPAAQALVFDSKSPDLSHASGHLVRYYRLPVAYATNAYLKTARHLAARVLAEPHCQAIRADRSFGAAGIHSISFHETEDTLRSPFVKGMCLVSMPEDPASPAIFFEAKREQHEDLLTPYTLTRVTVYEGGRVIAKLEAGHARPLAWLPKPIMGCFLNSGAARWDCFRGFSRGSVGLGGQGGYGAATLDAIAEALGLQRIGANSRRDEIAATPFPSLEAVVGANADVSLRVVDGLIANPLQRITIHDVKGLAERPEALRERAPAIVETIGRALANGRPTYETARVLQDLVAHLPAADFDAIAPALLVVLQAQPALGEDTVSQPMARRLGRLGAAAVPLLARTALSTPRRPFRGAIQGLCRTGAHAAPLAERLAVLGAAKGRPDRDLDAAVYVALLRMGRADIVER